VLSLNRTVEDKQFPRSWPAEALLAPQEGDTTWISAPVDIEAEAKYASEQMGFEANDHHTDEILARYLSEVRQFALLSPAKEQALWQRVMYWQMPTSNRLPSKDFVAQDLAC